MSVRVRLNNKVIKGIIMNITKEWRWYHNSTMVHLWVNLLISAREEAVVGTGVDAHLARPQEILRV